MQKTLRAATVLSLVVVVAWAAANLVPASQGSVQASVGTTVGGDATASTLTTDATAATAAAGTGTATPDVVDATHPSAVASLQVTYVDDTRTANGAARRLTVTVWYPVDAAGNARVDVPLVVFVHGFASSAAVYTDLEAQIASAGFIVAAPDFPVSSVAVTSTPARDITEQATDVSFVLDRLLDPTTVPAPLAGAIAGPADGVPVAVIGHSDGGVTAAGVAYNSAAADPRIGAAVVLSGGAFDFSGTWFGADPSPALLAIHGDADEINPFGASSSLYAGVDAPKMLVAVTGGSHLEPFTSGSQRSAIGGLIADFLATHLRGDAAASARLEADANVDGALRLVAAA